MSAEIEQLARDYFGAVGRREVSGMERLWGPSPVWRMRALGKELGPAEARDFFGGLYAALPDLQTRVDRVTADDRMATVEWHMSGTFDGGPFVGVKPTGRFVELDGCDCLEWEDGKLVSNTVYYDGLTFAREVGMLPPVDSPAERAMYGAFNALTGVRRRLRR